jgi:hypothetical protein
VIRIHIVGVGTSGQQKRRHPAAQQQRCYRDISTIFTYWPHDWDADLTAARIATQAKKPLHVCTAELKNPRFVTRLAHRRIRQLPDGTDASTKRASQINYQSP